MRSHFRQALVLRVVLAMPLKLGAQIHCLQPFGRIKGGLGSRVEARRNVLARKSHGLEVLLRQLMVEILLQIELHESAKGHNYQVRADLTQAKIPAGLAPSKTESLASQAWPAKLEQQRQRRSSFSRGIWSRVSRSSVVLSKITTSTYRAADFHVLDLLCDVLLQACIGLKPSHLPVSLGFFEGVESTSAISFLGLNKGYSVVRACPCLIGHMVALEHELPGVVRMRFRGFICPREKLQHNACDGQVEVEQCPGLDPVKAPAVGCVAFAVLVGVRACKALGSKSTEDHGVAQQTQDAIVEFRCDFVCKPSLGGAGLDRLLKRSAWVRQGSTST